SQKCLRSGEARILETHSVESCASRSRHSTNIRVAHIQVLNSKVKALHWGVPYPSQSCQGKRTAALWPCASSPSSSANFLSAAEAFLSEARLYSTTLVRRW